MKRALVATVVVGLAVFVVSIGYVSGCSESEAQGDAQVDSDADNGGDQVSPDGDRGTPGDADQPAADQVVDDGEKCGPDGECVAGAYCCKGYCANLQCDPLNCGKCGLVCPADTPFCSGGKCTNPMCMTKCDAGETCCSAKCCVAGQVCCTVVRAGPQTGPDCYWQHCPAGCPLCD